MVHSPTLIGRIFGSVLGTNKKSARRLKAALDSRTRSEFGDETCERERLVWGRDVEASARGREGEGGIRGQGGRQDENGKRPCERRSCLGGFGDLP